MRQALFTAFSLIGIANGISQLRYWLRPPTHRMHWWFEHMGAMLGACIAATTAFLVVNAGRLGLETFSLAVWLSPTVVGVPTIVLWTRYYQEKFAESASPGVPRRGSFGGICRRRAPGAENSHSQAGDDGGQHRHAEGREYQHRGDQQNGDRDGERHDAERPQQRDRRARQRTRIR